MTIEVIIKNNDSEINRAVEVTADCSTPAVTLLAGQEHRFNIWQGNELHIREIFLDSQNPSHDGHA